MLLQRLGRVSLTLDLTGSLFYYNWSVICPHTKMRVLVNSTLLFFTVTLLPIAQGLTFNSCSVIIGPFAQPNKYISLRARRYFWRQSFLVLVLLAAFLCSSLEFRCWNPFPVSWETGSSHPELEEMVDEREWDFVLRTVSSVCILLLLRDFLCHTYIPLDPPLCRFYPLRWSPGSSGKIPKFYLTPASCWKCPPALSRYT